MGMSVSQVSIIVAILLNVNIMIGAGIFIAPPSMASIVPEFSYLGWCVSSLIFLPVVYALSQLAIRLPGRGGLYNYARSGLGELGGFSCGWLYFLGCMGAEALQTVAFRDTLIARFDLPLTSDFALWAFNAVFLSSLAFLSTFDMKIIGSLQSVITLVKLSPLFFVVGLLIFCPWIEYQPVEQVLSSDTSFSSTLSGVLQTVPFAIFGFWGFEACSNISHRIKGSKKNASNALLISFVLVSLIYMAFHFELLKIMGSENLIHFRVDGFFHFLGWENKLLLSISSAILVGCILVSFVNAVFSELTAFSFTLQTLAREKYFPFSKSIAAYNKRGQPAAAIWLNAFIAFILASFVGTVDSIMVVTNIGMIGAFFLATASLLKLQWREQKLVSCLLTSICFISFLAVVYYTSLRIHSFKHVYTFVILTFVGACLYLTKRYKQKSQ